MQQQKLSKEEQLAWLAQLRQENINEENLEGTLELIVESIASLYEIYIELGIPREVYKEAFRKELENKQNQENSTVFIDPSSDNKVVSLRVWRDMVDYNKEAPKREDFNDEGYFLKCMLNHELMEGIYDLEFKRKDYEISPIFFVHPLYGNRGLSNYMNQVYGRQVYTRGVKKCVNVIYNPVMLKIQSRLVGGNPVIVKEISLEDREVNGKKAFQSLKKGYLLVLEVGEGLMKNLGLNVKELEKEMQQLTV